MTLFDWSLQTVITDIFLVLAFLCLTPIIIVIGLDLVVCSLRIGARITESVRSSLTERVKLHKVMTRGPAGPVRDDSAVSSAVAL